MEKIEAEKLPFSQVDHVGVIVKDMDRAVEYYQALGIGPFQSLNVIPTDTKLGGKPINVNDIKLKIRMAQMGPIRFELIQPLEGGSIRRSF